MFSAPDGAAWTSAKSSAQVNMLDVLLCLEACIPSGMIGLRPAGWSREAVLGLFAGFLAVAVLPIGALLAMFAGLELGNWYEDLFPPVGESVRSPASLS